MKMLLYNIGEVVAGVGRNYEVRESESADELAGGRHAVQRFGMEQR